MLKGLMINWPLKKIFLNVHVKDNDGLVTKSYTYLVLDKYCNFKLKYYFSAVERSN